MVDNKLVKCLLEDGINETWRDIQGYEGSYKISNLGNVKSLSRSIWNGKGYFTSREKLIYGSLNQKGYVQVELCKTPFMIHRLVALHFIENPENKSQVNHIDGNKQNNVISNLEWCMGSENVIHAFKLGLSYHGETSGRPKRKVCQLNIQTKEVINIYNSIAEAKKALNSKLNNISSVCNGLRNSCAGFGWKYYEEVDKNE